mmetsp:Transcript_9303/g.22822  ORF Transcript_9303/g.22822 Transcript_9303/m.22822 type:complete len:267 (-) Transcript_9303:326-1126(-)
MPSGDIVGSRQHHAVRARQPVDVHNAIGWLDARRPQLTPPRSRGRRLGSLADHAREDDGVRLGKVLAVAMRQPRLHLFRGSGKGEREHALPHKPVQLHPYGGIEGLAAHEERGEKRNRDGVALHRGTRHLEGDVLLGERRHFRHVRCVTHSDQGRAAKCVPTVGPSARNLAPFFLLDDATPVHVADVPRCVAPGAASLSIAAAEHLVKSRIEVLLVQLPLLHQRLQKQHADLARLRVLPSLQVGVEAVCTWFQVGVHPLSIQVDKL